jgi:hypothetical protein
MVSHGNNALKHLYSPGNLVGKVSTAWPVPAIYAKLWLELAASLPPGSQRRPAGHRPPSAPSGAQRNSPLPSHLFAVTFTDKQRLHAEKSIH